MLNRRTRSTLASNFVEAIEKLDMAGPLEAEDVRAIAAEINGGVVGAELDDALMQASDMLKTIADPDYDPADGSEYPEGCGP